MTSEPNIDITALNDIEPGDELILHLKGDSIIGFKRLLTFIDSEEIVSADETRIRKIVSEEKWEHPTDLLIEITISENWNEYSLLILTIQLAEFIDYLRIVSRVRPNVYRTCMLRPGALISFQFKDDSHVAQEEFSRLLRLGLISIEETSYMTESQVLLQNGRFTHSLNPRQLVDFMRIVYPRFEVLSLS